ncbi:hypothetical protein [Alkalicoccus urumqiensis]|nr:hypothetical protein [Alkalicoccus urumqiensis]
MMRYTARMMHGGLLLTRTWANDAIGSLIDAVRSGNDAPHTSVDAKHT